jgi:hypothetical protein
MELETCKDMDRWYDKSHHAVERIDYINTVQQERDVEEHGIQVLKESNIDHIRKLIKYWVKMDQEPHQEIQEKWAECERSRTKINWAMKDIGFPEFNTLNDFVNLRDIVK